MVRVIEEIFAENHGPDVRWYVMADDDTVLMIDNLVDVLSKYDHTKYYYIGMNSECIVSNFGMSFQMAFGGAGYALSYPLAQAVAKNMDTCIKRYPTLYGSDHILQACISDLGVAITLEKGFHQIDLRGDISGFLSAHPQSPFLSLHHLDLVAPIFPSMNRYDAVNHLMKAANVDQSRLLQQSTCYNNKHNWTFSVSWGYSVQIYDKIHSQSYLERPIETFGEWRKGAWPPYMFNVRELKSNNCGEVPNVLFFDNVEGTRLNHIVTTYVKKTPRSCGSSGNDDHSIDGVLKIRVFSPMHKLHVGDGNRRECCDILQPIGMDSMAIKLRTSHSAAMEMIIDGQQDPIVFFDVETTKRSLDDVRVNLEVVKHCGTVLFLEVDDASRRLTFVVDASSCLCEVLDECDAHAKQRYKDSGGHVMFDYMEKAGIA
ncbi:hypothetical protein RND71_002535 [Anisodus tanguticus]|uniref:Fringe n=1 Tax=Anisodus tanguticus TaxID=243964 RepID=A0AAE1T340_9SOLA|nr:hypothetical protein RND71_002535 [Anisodus tanguticus]